MELTLLLAVGIVVAGFVGFNIGGSSTGVAFGPSVGARLVSKHWAALLMTLFVFLGGWTVGRNVVETMGGQIVPSSALGLEASIVIMFFIGLALLISNIAGVPASTSMTAVGAIAGLGVAQGKLNWAIMGKIASWWFVAPIIAFWTGAVVGRYLYHRMDEYFHLEQSPGGLVQWERTHRVPVLRLGPDTSPRELVSSVLVLVIACFMAFSAGASNVANAVAPLVGGDALSMDAGILLAVLAIGLGAFTIARRTLETVGSGITDMPVLAALVVSLVSASIIMFLSVIGIPASLALSSTMCIAGLGWGRATREVHLRHIGEDIGKTGLDVSGSGEDGTSTVREKAKEGMEDIREETALFDPSTMARVVSMWILTPTVSATASYLVFALVV
jgi:PiT family inorganic phosphate transporter